MLRLLLVEDEEHKIGDLKRRLESSHLGSHEVLIARSVKDAVLRVMEHEFLLVILDMALPTFAKERNVGEGGGVAQASGGVEVLRAMQQADRKARIIVVTQYPDITISGERIRLTRIRHYLRKKYTQDVIGVVLYSYNDTKWISSFDNLLEKLR